MSNPWMKKNPFLSMWLSGANAVAGKVRSQATAQTKRNATNAAKATTNAFINFWTGHAVRSRAPKKTRR